MTFRIYSLVVYLATFVLATTNALAHDPGISFTDVLVKPHSIETNINFAWTDIDTFVPLDKNRDRKLDDIEFRNAKAKLEELVPNLVDLRSGDESLKVENRTLDFDGTDAIRFYIEFSKSRDDNTVTLYSRLIDQLPRGHRQFVNVSDVNNHSISNHILSARYSSVSFDASPNRLNAFSNYVAQGLWHIWLGFDHILFLLTLLLPAVLVHTARRWRPVDDLGSAIRDTAKTVTMFTVAHSLTLALAVFDVVTLPSRLVESGIAATLIIASVNNLKPFIALPRWVMAFSFGLVHGLGFAGALKELGIAPGNILLPLAGFNLGVEAGQLVMVALTIPLLYAMRGTWFYRFAVYRCSSVAIASVAGIWLWQRATAL